MPPLQALELACGHPLGSGPPVALRSTAASPREALEAAILPALQNPPCLVSFSGGVDSTLVLAVAVDVARRQRLAAPVPITWRFPAAARTGETRWQEQVVSALAIADWERLTGDGELDFVGPVAQRVLSAVGIVYPANAFLIEPLLRRAGGGSLLTGIGGDQVLGLWRGKAIFDVLTRRRRPGWRTPLAMLRALSPPAPRAVVERPRVPEHAWLTAPARDEVAWRVARQNAGEPAGWASHLRWRLSLRDTMELTSSVEAIARTTGATVVNPLLDHGFVASLAAAGGRAGFGDRRDTIRALFSEVMPPDVLERRRKALFGEVFWHEATRELVAGWDGGGFDERLVDPVALKRLWTADAPAMRTALLVQQVWLARHRAATGGYAIPHPSKGAAM